MLEEMDSSISHEYHDLHEQALADAENDLVLLIVNTATRCGFTPQYKELESLYEKYAKDGFEILDFPCNQFGVEDLEADIRALSK